MFLCVSCLKNLSKNLEDQFLFDVKTKYVSEYL